MQTFNVFSLMCCFWVLSFVGLKAQPVHYEMTCDVDTTTQSPEGGGQPAYHLYRPRTDQVPARSFSFFSPGRIL